MPTLHWIGKDKVVKHHHEVPFKTLQRGYVHTAPEGTSVNSADNRIIHGDNLEALKALLPEFEGRVKCVGGESGPNARPMQQEWVLNIKRQCDEQCSAFFFKQWGGWGVDGKKRA